MLKTVLGLVGLFVPQVRTVDATLTAFTKTIDALDAIASVKKEAAIKARTTAEVVQKKAALKSEKVLSKAQAHENEANRAVDIATKLKELLS